MQSPPLIPGPAPQSPFDMQAKKQLQKSANLKVLGGILGQVASVAIPAILDSESMALIFFALALRFAFAALFVWGCSDYARSKGYSWGYGFFGLLGCLGLVILVVIPDKWKPGSSNAAQWPTNYPRNPDA